MRCTSSAVGSRGGSSASARSVSASRVVQPSLQMVLDTDPVMVGGVGAGLGGRRRGGADDDRDDDAHRQQTPHQK